MFGLSIAKLVGLAIAAAAILSFVTLAFHWKDTMTARGKQLDTICAATRAAANRPKLDCARSADEITFLGDALKDVAAKTDQARASDAANKTRVETEQSTINQDRGSSYANRIADARARAAERVRNGTPAANPGSGRTAPVSGVPAPTRSPVAAAGQDGLSADDKLIATEQAIQLDELIKWVKAQAAVDVNGAQAANSSDVRSQP
jgi:hypothetical protein